MCIRDREYTNEVCIYHCKLLKPQNNKPQIADHVHTYTPMNIPNALVENLVKHEPHATSPSLDKIANGYKPPFVLLILVKFPEKYKA